MSLHQSSSAVSAVPALGGYGATRRGTRNSTVSGADNAPAAASPNSASNGSDAVNRANNNNSNNATSGAFSSAASTASASAAASAVGSPRADNADGKGASTDSVIEELKALAKSMLEATNAARRRTSSIEHRNSYEALMHAIENRVNSEGVPTGAAAGTSAAPSSPSSSQQQQQQRHVDPSASNARESEMLSAHLIEQLTDVPAELSPGSRLRQLQQLEQLQQQQQLLKKTAKGGRAAPAKQSASAAAPATATTNTTAKAVPSQRTAALPAVREEIPAEEEVEDVADMDELAVAAAPAKSKDTTTTTAAAARRPAQNADQSRQRGSDKKNNDAIDDDNEEEDDDDADCTAYDGVRAQVLFKPVNRAAYDEVLASTWKPEGLTRKVAVSEEADQNQHRHQHDGDSSSSSSSGSSHHDGAKKGDEDEEEEEEAMASVATRNKARKANAAAAAAGETPPTRVMKVYRVPAFPYGGGVTEQQARRLQRQFDACIQNGEHLHSNAPGPKLITKRDFDRYAYPEMDEATAQMDVTSFKPTSPYEFVVEVEREVRFDAVKAREERRRRFKRLVQENRAPATMGTFDLRIIMDPFKTGFEEEKNFPIIPGTVIAGRYEIIQLLGKATFSRAVRCYDLHDPIYDEEDDEEEEGDDEEEEEEASSSSPADSAGEGTADKATRSSAKAKKAKKPKLLGYGQVCLKIINNTKDFFDQALDEIRLLTLLNRQRDPDEAHIVRLIDAFYYKEHVMLVTELLRDTLYDYGKYNREEEEEFYFTVPRLRRLTRQIVEALTYVHSLNLIHTDLKPENIMFVSYSRCIVKVIDFGSSCFLSDHLSSYIQSRSYRAPEVVLGCDYDGRIDVWSLGAILVEMVTGDVLFTSDTVPEMLARIVYVCGTPFPRHMLWEGRHTSDYINKFGCIYEYGGSGEDQQRNGGAAANASKGEEDAEEPYCLYTPVPTMVPHTCNAPKKLRTSTSSRRPAGPYSVLREKLAAANMEDESFLSFVEACLTLDHKRRPTTAELLEHPFIKNERI